MSLITIEDLRPYGITLNIPLPGGATATGMTPDGLPDAARRTLLAPEIMGPPVTFLASAEAAGVAGEGIVGTEFECWLAEFRSRPRPSA